MGSFKYEINEKNTVKGNFHIYQSRNGAIQLMMGNCVIALTKEQVEKLHIDVYSLQDFDYDKYKEYYEYTNKIVIKNGIGTLHYTVDELKKMLDDLTFLKDAFLVLLNEKVTDKSDLPFNKEQVLKFAKEMYDNSNYSQEFIDECFNNIL